MREAKRRIVDNVDGGIDNKKRRGGCNCGEHKEGATIEL